MAALIVLSIILGCGAYQYFKGSIFQAVTTIIVIIISSAIAFGYFEVVAAFVTMKRPESNYLPWMQPVFFAMIFGLAFAILQTVTMQLATEKIDFGVLPERIGRPILGSFMGLLLSGLLLTAAAMAPLPNKYPYQRFDAKNPQADSPSKVLLNVDGFVSGWFGILSKGSLSAIRNPQSFAAIHPGFLDQLYLNRHNDSDEISPVAKVEAVAVPTKEGAWQIPAADIKDSEGNAITTRAGHGIVVVRMTMSKRGLDKAGDFTLGQVRLVCKQKNSEGQDGINAYPLGYFTGQNEIAAKKLHEKITVERSHFPGTDTKRAIDFAFSVPNDYTPVTLQFKQNCIMKVPRLVSSDKAPPISPLIDEPKPATPGDEAEEETFRPPSANRGSNIPEDAKLSPATRGLVPTLELDE